MERDLVLDTIILYARAGKGFGVSTNVTFSLTFLGAAGTVTGSKHLLEFAGRRILVDCGLFQGLKELRLRNWEPLPVDPAMIDAVILIHAHLDHCGYLPRLVAGGYRPMGSRSTSRPFRYTRPSPPHASWIACSRWRYERPMPLWSKPDEHRMASGSTSDVHPMQTGSASDAPTVEFINAGHLLGSSYARIRVGDRTILFGGDLGRYGRPVLPDPSSVAEADVLLVESTYGDRLHESDDDGERLASMVRDSAQRGGKLIIRRSPSAALKKFCTG